MPPRALHSRLHKRRDGAPSLAIVVSPDPDADVRTFARALADWTVVTLADYSERTDLHTREIHVVIVNVIACSDDEMRVRINRAASMLPDAPLAVYVRIEGATSRILFKAHLLKVAGVIFASDDDQPDCALHAVLEARAVWRGRQLDAALPSGTPPWLRDLAQNAVALGYTPTRCERLARLAGLGLRDADRKLKDLGLPRVEHWLIFGHLVCVVDAFACGLRLIQDCDRDVGYADAASVRRAARNTLENQSLQPPRPEACDT